MLLFLPSFMDPSVHSSSTHLPIDTSAFSSLVHPPLCLGGAPQCRGGGGWHWEHCDKGDVMAPVFWSLQTHTLLIATFKRQMHCHKSPEMCIVPVPTLLGGCLLCQTSAGYPRTVPEDVPASCNQERPQQAALHPPRGLNV